MAVANTLCIGRHSFLFPAMVGAGS